MNSASHTSAAQVTVWRIDVAAHEPHLDALRTLLSDEERQRAARFMRREDAVRSIVARAGLRILLGRETGIAPQALSFVYGSKGKPALAPPAPGVHFNVSHSGDVVLIALSSDCSLLGIDVEQVRTLTDAASMVDYVLTARERVVYEALGADEREAAFYRAWTCKEALLKATGEGLGLGLGYFEVTLGPREVPRVLAVGKDPVEATAWQLRTVEVSGGYVGALAVRAPRVELSVQDLAAGQAVVFPYVS